MKIKDVVIHLKGIIRYKVIIHYSLNGYRRRTTQVNNVVTCISITNGSTDENIEGLLQTQSKTLNVDD